MCGCYGKLDFCAISFVFDTLFSSAYTDLILFEQNGSGCEYVEWHDLLVEVSK
jgi:hypothetical protein